VQDILRRLGRRIRELRIERGFASQEEFADYCKMHRTFLGHLETGRKDFRLTTVIRVAEALGVTMSELFAGVERGEAPKTRRYRDAAAIDAYAVRRELATLEGGSREQSENQPKAPGKTGAAAAKSQAQLSGRGRKRRPA
jgi:transcriptional regulator with XRE-family HTH domain